MIASTNKIVLPPNRTNGWQHVIPLAPAARAVLDQRPPRPGRDLIFGRHVDRPLRGWSVLKGALDRRIAASGIEVAPWGHHDLRRSCATRMADLGVQPHVIEAVLNHVSGSKHGVAGIYNRSSYEREKATALVVWADHLLAIVEGRATKVISIRGAS